MVLSGFVALGQDLKNQYSAWTVIQNYLILSHVKDNIENKTITTFVNSRVYMEYDIVHYIIFKSTQDSWRNDF